jgi:hypothetical protein
MFETKRIYQLILIGFITFTVGWLCNWSLASFNSSSYFQKFEVETLVISIFFIIISILIFLNIVQDDRKGINQKIVLKSILKIILLNVFFWFGFGLLRIVIS